jgi:hypothetical protein
MSAVLAALNGRRLHAREVAAADLVIVLVDHPAFPLEKIAAGPAAARHQLRCGAQASSGETLSPLWAQPR